MPRGSHRAGSGVRWPVVGGAIVAIAAVAVAAWFLIGRESADEVANFSFDIGKIGGSAIADRAPESELEEAGDQIRETLDAMYVVGFVDPGKWRNGTFPDIYDAFTEEAAEKVREDLANLTVGEDAAKIDTVDPITGRLSIRFLVDEEVNLIAATAHTTFSANALATDGGNVAIQHDGTYYLEPDGEGWLINAYDVEGIVTRVDKPLPDPNATPE
ncbi:MAG: hypothetical protein ACRDH9_12850 [Actinomycetota bacterium]